MYGRKVYEGTLWGFFTYCVRLSFCFLNERKSISIWQRLSMVIYVWSFRNFISWVSMGFCRLFKKSQTRKTFFKKSMEFVWILWTKVKNFFLEVSNFSLWDLYGFYRLSLGGLMDFSKKSMEFVWILWTKVRDFLLKVSNFSLWDLYGFYGLF